MSYHKIDREKSMEPCHICGMYCDLYMSKHSLYWKCKFCGWRSDTDSTYPKAQKHGKQIR